jgi:hypothetical protein
MTLVCQAVLVHRLLCCLGPAGHCCFWAQGRRCLLQPPPLLLLLHQAQQLQQRQQRQMLLYRHC